MAKTAIAGGTKIEWADFTFNPWWGCERVSPACAHCYADTLSKRYAGGKQLWGADHEFRFFGDKHWAEPLKWARTAPAKLGRRPRVFCASMADVFEDRDEIEEHRDRLFDLIYHTPELDWLLLTKRPEDARGYLYRRWLSVTPRSPHPIHEKGWQLPRNVWLGVSIENSRFTWRADVLREIPAAVRFISAEPLLGSLFSRPDDVVVRDLKADPLKRFERNPLQVPGLRRSLDLTGIDWVIAGGESGHGARRTDPQWLKELAHACRTLGDWQCTQDHVTEPCGVCSACLSDQRERPAVFVKQLGAVLAKELGCTDTKGGAIDEWPAALRIREFPRSAA